MTDTPRDSFGFPLPECDVCGDHVPEGTGNGIECDDEHGDRAVFYFCRRCSRLVLGSLLSGVPASYVRAATEKAKQLVEKAAAFAERRGGRGGDR